jgi:hypothetical protein
MEHAKPARSTRSNESFNMAGLVSGHVHFWYAASPDAPFGFTGAKPIRRVLANSADWGKRIERWR